MRRDESRRGRHECLRHLALILSCAFLFNFRTVERPSPSPLVTFRVVFLTGSADDPVDHPGLASLTAAMLAQGGSKSMAYEQIVEKLFPMASTVTWQVDKEMTTFSASTHADNLEEFYGVFRAMLLDPGWRGEDLKRLRDQHINALRVGLRGNNEEELGKEVLYNLLYAKHPYGHHNLGTVSGLGKITDEDLRSFYRTSYTQANLILGIAGGYKPEFPARVKKDFGALPEGKIGNPNRPATAKIEGLNVTIIEKNTRSVAVSMGFPIDVRRGHRDYPALLVAQSALGQHRASGGRLYNNIREKRGLNYGDYAYIEYFPRGMFLFEPDANLARPSQVFQIWIRPLEIPTAHFGLRLALHELDKFVKDGLTAEEFQKTRSFLVKYANLLTKTKRAELGYAIDSLYYGTPEYTSYVRNGLAKLTPAEVNDAIRRHLGARGMHLVMVASDGEAWKKRLLADDPSPMKYNSPKPEAIMLEDQVVEKMKIGLAAAKVRVLDVSSLFE